MTHYQTISASFETNICRVRFQRPQADNALNGLMIEEIGQVLTLCEDEQAATPVTVLVLEGSPSVFCAGGDFAETASTAEATDPAPLYQNWLRMVNAPFITISVVRGRANAGGVGFVAASDIVLADQSARFSLSELLFGLYPACVLPFLARRIGLQRAHYMTLMTQPFSAQQAFEYGLVDALDEDANMLLTRHLARLRRLTRPAIRSYKRYMAGMAGELERVQSAALTANRAMFKDPEVRRNIQRFVNESKFPWEE